MKKLLCFFLVILVLVSPALAADGSTLVYTTRTGECYHRYSCSSLSKSCYETTLSQAVADGYRPCGRCHPPTLDSGSSSAKPSLSDPHRSEQLLRQLVRLVVLRLLLRQLVVFVRVLFRSFLVPSIGPVRPARK